MSTSDGSTADYYQLPAGSTELQHLISHRDMNAQIGEIFRACYRYGIASHSSRLRDAKKIRFYIEAEIARLEALQPAFDWDAALSQVDDKMGVEEPATDVANKLREVYAALPAKMAALGREICGEEPAAQIDDESDRQQAVQQNGPDGAVYDDPWYGAPEWAMFKAQDADGVWCWYSQCPVSLEHKWACGHGAANNHWSYTSADVDHAPNPNWRDTLIERTSG